MANYTNPGFTTNNHQLFVKHKMQDGVLENNVFFRKLKEMGRLEYGKGGTQIGPYTVRSSTIPVAKFAGLEGPPIIQPNINQQFSHQWTGMISQYALSWWDDIANTSSEQIEDMQGIYAEAMRNDVETQIATDLMTDGSSGDPPGISGLPAFMKQTGTYGTLAQTATFWKPTNVVGTTGVNGTTYLNNPYQVITYVQVNATHGAGQSQRNSPNLGMTTRNMFTHLANWLEVNHRRITTFSKDVEYGLQNIEINGMPIFWDPYCTSQTMYLLNMSKMVLYSVPQKLLTPRSGQFPAQTIGEYHQILMKWQLVCEEPRFQGYISTSGVT